jgi:AcrR family transcriptional regulator
MGKGDITTNIRVRFTQKTLQDSLVTLMKETSIMNISTRDICETAGISRSTFYTYYDDQYDLLRQMEKETIVEMEKIVQPYISGARKSSSQTITALLQDILRYIINNNNSIQVLLSENGDSAFQKKFFRNGIEYTWHIIEAVGIKAPDEKVAKYAFAFLVGGFLTLVQEWLKSGMDTPAPDLAKMLVKLMREALR